MIRLLRRLGRFPVGAETDYFDAAAEAAFILDGTAERVGEPNAPRGASKTVKTVKRDGVEASAGDAPDYAHMKKDELLRIAMARGLDISPRAKVAELIPQRLRAQHQRHITLAFAIRMTDKARVAVVAAFLMGRMGAVCH